MFRYAVTVVGSNYYLYQGGYIFDSVSSSVSCITEKLLDHFSQNLIEKWHMGPAEETTRFFW